MSRSHVERLGLGLLALVVIAAMAAAVVSDDAVGRAVGPDAVGPTSTSSPTTAPGGPGAVRPTPTGTPAQWVVTASGGTPLWSADDGVVDEVAAGGLAWPVLGEQDGGYRVATHCDRDGWVASEDVVRPRVPVGRGVAGAVVVVDAGHGGVDTGAVGPEGLTEAAVNLDVADRLRDLLERPNDVDADSGAVAPGDQWPAVAGVVMTRDPDDAVGGDQRTSLSFRGELATAVDADAMVSIHHNAGDTSTFDESPSEVLFSVDGQPSRRLAALVLEELRRSLTPLADEWRGTTLRGTIGRADPDGTDYYTLLQEARVPAVITEALYLSSASGEELAQTDTYRQAYAEALYRALVRFLGSDDEGPEVNDPETFDPGEGDPFDFSDCSMAAPAPVSGATEDS